MRSGSKKGSTAKRPPELSAWQARVLYVLARSPLAAEATFGGATALSAVYLHHRKSADLDFFLARELAPSDLRAVVRVLEDEGFRVEARSMPPRTMLILSARGRNVGHVDFSYFPYDPVAAPKRWRGLRVDAIEDIAVNQLQAVLTRARDRDFIDLYFLLREGSERDVEPPLSLARAKFDSGAGRVTLAECLLRAEQIGETPKMIRRVSLPKLREFFVALARQLVARGPE